MLVDYMTSSIIVSCQIGFTFQNIYQNEPNSALTFLVLHDHFVITKYFSKAFISQNYKNNIAKAFTNVSHCRVHFAALHPKDTGTQNSYK